MISELRPLNAWIPSLLLGLNPLCVEYQTRIPERSRRTFPVIGSTGVSKLRCRDLIPGDSTADVVILSLSFNSCNNYCTQSTFRAIVVVVIQGSACYSVSYTCVRNSGLRYIQQIEPCNICCLNNQNIISNCV